MAPAPFDWAQKGVEISCTANDNSLAGKVRQMLDLGDTRWVGRGGRLSRRRHWPARQQKTCFVRSRRI